MTTATIDAPLAALERAQKRLAENDTAGRKAMQEAWAGEPGRIPVDMLTAASAIRRIRLERAAALKEMADAKSEAAARAEAHQKYAANIRDGITALIRGQNLAPNSPLIPIASTVQSLQNALVELRAELESVRNAARDTFTDSGLTELPGLAGYFAGATPMLRAAEAGATFICTTDRVVREAYLRRRGWKLAANNAWRVPGEKSYTVPYETAVIQAVKADCAPFAGLGTREWKGVHESKDSTSGEVVAVHVNHESAAAPAETVAVSLTRPVGVVAKWQDRPDTAEVIEMPRMEDGPEN